MKIVDDILEDAQLTKIPEWLDEADFARFRAEVRKEIRKT